MAKRQGKYWLESGVPHKTGIAPGQVRDEKAELDARVNRTQEYYRTADASDDIRDAEEDKKHKRETDEVKGLCADCNNLRYVKTKLALRDKYWCNRFEIRQALPGTIMEIGDEVTSCPWYSPRVPRGQMSLRDMFDKAVLIQVKEYDPGSKEDEKRGIIYL